MILTVTPDPVLDKILFIEEWTPGVPMQALGTTASVGGKGLDASIALRHLEQETVGMAFLAGRTGKELALMIEARGISLEAVWTGGETRTAHVITEIKPKRHSHLFSGQLEVDEGQCRLFFQRLSNRLLETAWVICGGIIPACLPANFYYRVIKEAGACDVPVLVDSFRDFILEAIPARPAVVKMNWQEFEWTFAEKAQGLEELLARGKKVYQEAALQALVITCGPEGILAFTPQGIFHAMPPRLDAVNAAGAGDAASAAIAWRRSVGDGWAATLHWAAAVSAAVVLTAGTADCRMEDIQRIYPQVEVKHISP